MPYNSALNFQGAANCTSANVIGTQVYLGTAFSDPAAAATFNSTSGFTITLQNCLNNSETINDSLTCNGSGNGISSDPVNNPEVQVSGSVYPSQEGMPQD
jgi:hypothetical protein